MIQKFLAVILMFILLPLILIIALCIVLEGIFNKDACGPLFYKEERLSKGDKFEIIKFRSFKSSKMKGEKIGDITTVEREASNLTKTGRILKKFYIDELPQIFNIIRGEMSFVGPRPLIFKYYKEHVDNGNLAKDRLLAGWTGPWQSQKGYITSMEEMIRVENEYFEKIKNLSYFKRAMYDLRIILRTFRVILEGKAI